MTHVLDEPIEAAEDVIHESFLHRHVYDWWEPGTPKKQKQEARNSLRSMVAVLRILRAEREGRRSDDLRAEGRREERERVVKAGRRFAAHTLKTFKGTPLQDASEFADEMVGEFVDAVGHGDHWRGGEG